MNELPPLQTGRRSWVDGHPDEALLRALMDKKLAAPPGAPIESCVLPLLLLLPLSHSAADNHDHDQDDYYHDHCDHYDYDA
jgi:hypothetical protein